MIAAGQLMTCIKSLQSIWNVAKTNTLVKTCPGAIWQPLRREKGHFLVDEECNLNLLLPPSGRAKATSLQLNPCLLVPVAKCGFSFGHVNLKTSLLWERLSLPHPPLCWWEPTVRTLKTWFSIKKKKKEKKSQMNSAQPKWTPSKHDLKHTHRDYQYIDWSMEDECSLTQWSSNYFLPKTPEWSENEPSGSNFRIQH